MPYDRFDSRREPSRHEPRSRHEDDRGFFERAGDEISSWFGDDEPRRRHPEHDRDRAGLNRGDWNRGDDRTQYKYGGWGERSDQREYRDRPTGAYGREPMQGDRGPAYGEDRGRSFGSSYDRPDTQWGRDDYRGTGYAGSSRGNDRQYDAWKQQQVSALDRDYQQYCRERQERFENDFGSWREQRMSKRGHLNGIRGHMDVVGSDGETIGKVDCVKGDHIVLTKSDSPDGRHHSIDCSMIDTIDGDQVRLDRPAQEAKSRWDEADRRGMFGRDDGEHNLNRAFSGTYED